MKKYQRGERGFIQYRKRLYLAKTLLFEGIALDIYALGLLLNYGSSRNIFSILAVLMVLPFAKSLVEAIILFPFDSVDEETYKKAAAAVPEEATLFSDVVITSPEKVMNLHFLAEIKGVTLGLIGKPGQDPSYIETYLGSGVRAIEKSYRVKVFPSEEKFLKELKKLQPSELKDEVEEEVLQYLNSLMVR